MPTTRSIHRRASAVPIAALLLCLGWSQTADASSAGVLAVSAGANHSCAIGENGALSCWGDDSYGQLDAPEGEFTSVSSGRAHTCAIAVDAHLVCWGDDSDGQLDNVPEGEFVAVSAGGEHACAISTWGHLVCWGDDSGGQVSGTPSSWSHHWGYLHHRHFTALSAGGGHTCAIDTWGHLACWGDNSYGQLNQIPYGHFVAISAGYTHTCAIRTGGQLACWGDESRGQRLDETPEGEFVAVAAGYAHTCAIDTEAHVSCWGDDSHGQLEAPEGEFVSISAGGGHTCAIDTGGGVACWGDNSYGQSAPELAGPSLPRAVIGLPYSQQLETTSLDPAPSFSLSGGALPDGLGLDDGGLLSGIATAAGDYSFTVTADNGIAPAAEREAELPVVGAPLPGAASAEQVTGETASLSAGLDPQNLPAKAWFEYWPAGASSQDAVQTPPQTVAAGVSTVQVSAQIGGLSAEAEYDFRLAAVNELGPEPAYGPVSALSTEAGGLPSPTAGKTFNIDPAGGVVWVKCPGDTQFQPLLHPAQIPVDCLVDASKGVVALIASKGGDETQSAYFWGGIFNAHQEPGQNQDAIVALAGQLKCERRKSGSRSSSAGRIYERGRSGRGRHVWGSGKGNYKTVGNYGSASVRGTIWLVKDRCDGSTKFKVRRGTVWVHDFVTGKLVVLQVGQQYIAHSAIHHIG